MNIGVLALQGDFREHIDILQDHGVGAKAIRSLKELNESFDGLILPGGESTVIGRLLKASHMLEVLRERINEGLPVFGTCAGLILLAKELEGGEKPHIGTMDIIARRNAYGRQLGSFTQNGSFGSSTVPMVFIRAPYITAVGPDVEVLSVVAGKIVAAREKNMLVTAFHPELTRDFTAHRLFLDMIS
ncbi:MAG: pyridoxal 5'-phosphate synthase glutaminase subunit PdxT [Bacillota bacterium]|nr:pyridoxal 5'-phosphate synthase glutaminase subunit PdxT [Bacillota bacterium]